MDPQTCLGVQGPDNYTTVPPKVIQFFPDGTIQFQSLGNDWNWYVVFVTDQIGGGTLPDLRQTDQGNVVPADSNYARRVAQEGKGGSVHIRMIRLLKGGSIKLLDPKVHVEHLKL
jgi:hypothetical protein